MGLHGPNSCCTRVLVLQRRDRQRVSSFRIWERPLAMQYWACSKWQDYIEWERVCTAHLPCLFNLFCGRRGTVSSSCVFVVCWYSLVGAPLLGFGLALKHYGKLILCMANRVCFQASFSNSRTSASPERSMYSYVACCWRLVEIFAFSIAGAFGAPSCTVSWLLFVDASRFGVSMQRWLV